jgi:hypothetical protein
MIACLPWRTIRKSQFTQPRIRPERDLALSGKIDPAALLIAVFTVAFAPLTTTGPWDPMNTVIAVVVGTVILAFTFPRERTLEDEQGNLADPGAWKTAAQATAYGLIIAIGIAWIVQLVWFALVPDNHRCPVLWSPDNAPQECVRATEIAGYVTYVALGIGLVAGIVLYRLMRSRIKKIVPPVPQDSARSK